MPASRISVTAVAIAYNRQVECRSILRNADATNSVDVVSEGAAFGTGFLLAPGESVGVYLKAGEPIFLICDTAKTATVHVLATGA